MACDYIFERVSSSLLEEFFLMPLFMKALSVHLAHWSDVQLLMILGCRLKSKYRSMWYTQSHNGYVICEVYLTNYLVFLNVYYTE